jgi:hypothetical protein
VIFEELGSADISAQGIDGLVPGYFHHFEQRGPIFSGAGEKAGSKAVPCVVFWGKSCEGSISFDNIGNAFSGEGLVLDFPPFEKGSKQIPFCDLSCFYPIFDGF